MRRIERERDGATDRPTETSAAQYMKSSSEKMYEKIYEDKRKVKNIVQIMAASKESQRRERRVTTNNAPNRVSANVVRAEKSLDLSGRIRGSCHLQN